MTFLSKRIRIVEAKEEFLAAKRARGLTDATMQNYRLRLTRFGERFSVLPLSTRRIEEHLLTIVGPQNRHGEFRVLRTFYRWLKARRKIGRNPIEYLEPPVVPRTVARSLCREELQQLLRYEHRPVDGVFLWLLADTGLRIGEAVSIRDPWQFHSGVVVVKGKVGEREVPISNHVRDAVLPFLPWPWTTTEGAKGAVRKAFRRAGIRGKRASAQTLRHTFCRLWTGDESLLEGIMGWTSARMRKVYRPYDVERAKAQHRECSPARSVSAGHQLQLLDETMFPCARGPRRP